MRKRGGDRRFSTGIPALDLILRGGIPPYSMVVIAGAPGAGKTILSQQILFANARKDGKVVYLTTVSESPMKAARYQSEFTFFDPALFGDTVIFMDVGQTIRKEGISRALEVIADTLREIQPSVVVIDSFKAIHDLASTPQEMRSFVYDLAVELAAMQATTFLVGEYEEQDIARMPEFAVADGIMWLYTEIRNDQQMRFIRILKMRGVDYLSGAYNFNIKKTGLEIYTLVEESIRPDAIRGDAISMGLPELDELMHGGVPSGTPFLVTGSAGTGKSTLAMQYIYRGAAEYGDKCIYFSYEETPEQIIANAKHFGWDLRPLIEAGKLRIEYRPLPQVNAHEQALRIRDAITEMGATRAVIDSLTMLLNRIDQPDVIRRIVYQLSAVLRNAGCTSLIISDPPIGSSALSRFGVEESIIDGVIVLRIRADERIRERTLEIYKLRGVNHAAGEHTMTISSRGIQLFPRVEEMVR